jgi:hypothetical protein
MSVLHVAAAATRNFRCGLAQPAQPRRRPRRFLLADHPLDLGISRPPQFLNVERERADKQFM